MLRYDVSGAEVYVSSPRTAISSIVVLKLDHIGDFLLTWRAFKSLREAFPDTEITLVCGAHNAGLAQTAALFDHVVAYNYFERDLQRNQRRALDQILSGYFDLAIDCRHDADTRHLLSGIHARYRAGFFAPNIELDLSLPSMEVAPYDQMQGVHAELRLQLLVAAVIATYGRPQKHPIQKLIASGVVEPQFSEQRYVVIAPGSGNELKNWPVNNYTLLAKRLTSQLGLSIVILGSVHDMGLARLLEAALPKHHVQNLVGSTQLTDLPRLLQGAAAYVGNDSGITHMAGLLNVPTLCIFAGVADPQIWMPRGEQSVLIRYPVACAPCKHSKPEFCKSNQRCTTSILIETVWAELISLLDGQISRHSLFGGAIPAGTEDR